MVRRVSKVGLSIKTKIRPPAFLPAARSWGRIEWFAYWKWMAMKSRVGSSPQTLTTRADRQPTNPWQQHFTEWGLFHGRGSIHFLAAISCWFLNRPNKKAAASIKDMTAKAGLTAKFGRQRTIHAKRLLFAIEQRSTVVWRLLLRNQVSGAGYLCDGVEPTRWWIIEARALGVLWSEIVAIVQRVGGAAVRQCWPSASLMQKDSAIREEQPAKSLGG